MSTHPPIFTAMCRRFSPRHPVSVLARRLAATEPDARLNADIDRLMNYQRHPRFPNYRADGRYY